MTCSPHVAYRGSLGHSQLTTGAPNSVAAIGTDVRLNIRGGDMAAEHMELLHVHAQKC